MMVGEDVEKEMVESQEMKHNLLSPPPGTKKARKRVGRGTGSGHGKTSCRGSKGQNSRSGGGVRPGFEGGQMPLARRLPKRGFYNPFRVEYQAVNVSQLEAFDAGSEIDPALLLSRKLVRKASMPVKILGKGDITRAVTVKAHAVSAAAKEKIEKAGGRIELIAAPK
jgi:large subunit ribosomal protein L15